MPPDHGDPAGSAPGSGPAPTALAWRVSPVLAAGKGIGAVLLALATGFAGDPLRIAVAGVAAALLGAFALRDYLAPVRLAADPEGVTVITGYAGRRRLPWSAIERVRVDDRRGVGVRSEVLEIDTGETLHLLSRYDLNAPVTEAAEQLARIRP